MSTEIKRSPELERLALVIERMRTAVYAMTNAGGLEHRRAAQAATHLEFEIAPLLAELDFDATIARIGSDAIAAYEKERGRTRSILTLGTRQRLNDQGLQPGQITTCTARPQVPMLIERLAIPDRIAADFLILDIGVGGRSQLNNIGPISGELFAVSYKGPSPITFETLQTAMDFVIVVEYIGTKETGESFLCNAIGLVARDAEFDPTMSLPRMGDPISPPPDPLTAISEWAPMVDDEDEE